jgi:hypothetical protein
LLYRRTFAAFELNSYPGQKQINLFRSLTTFFSSGMTIAYDYAETFSSEHAMQGAVLEVGGPLQGARRGPPAQTSGDYMKTPIKIRKREKRNVHDPEISSARTNSQRTTEVIVKNWIIESREGRRLALNQLQHAFRRKEI